MESLPAALGRRSLPEILIDDNPRIVSLPEGIQPEKATLTCRGTQLRLVVMKRPIKSAVRAELESRLVQLEHRWAQSAPTKMDGQEPAWAKAAREELDRVRMGTSNTVKSTVSAAQATENWRVADAQIREWAETGKSATTEKLRLLNKMLGEGLIAFKDDAQVKFGEFRRICCPVVPRGFFVDERGIGAEMGRFDDWLKEQEKKVSSGQMKAEELATLACQRLVSIHPFPDVNGRTARLATDWILHQHGFPPTTVPDDFCIILSSGSNPGIQAGSRIADHDWRIGGRDWYLRGPQAQARRRDGVKGVKGNRRARMTTN